MNAQHLDIPLTRPMIPLFHEGLTLLCCSPVRWKGPSHRLHKTMLHYAQHQDVLFFEEAKFEGETLRLEVTEITSRLNVVTPYMPAGLSAEEQDIAMRCLLQLALNQFRVDEFVAWMGSEHAETYLEMVHPVLSIADYTAEKDLKADLSGLQNFQTMRNSIPLKTSGVRSIC